LGVIYAHDDDGTFSRWSRGHGVRAPTAGTAQRDRLLRIGRGVAVAIFEA